VIDERINTGVIVFGDGRLQTRFLRDWRRVRQFGSEDITFLLDFAERTKQATAAQLPLRAPNNNGPDHACSLA